MRRLLVSFSLCCALLPVFSGIPALEREINLSITNEPAISVFRKIQDQTGLIFSYPSSILGNIAPVSLQLKQKTVREALAIILPKNIIYKSKNNYIILKEKPIVKDAKKKELSGYVYDKTTDKKIANVTVYDKTSLQSVTTDDYGFYKISLPKEKETITVNKSNYNDTVIQLASLQDNGITNIALSPVNDSIKRNDSIGWRTKLHDFSNYTNELFKNFKGYVNTLNIKDTLHQPFQISFLPFIGTNHRLSGNVYNHVSVNIFGGYARGLDGFEAGGFFNIDKENVKGVQLAGFFNLVGDTVTGTQMAGFFNVTGKQVRGFQGAGFFNLNLADVEGVNAAGFINVNRRRTKGLQLAGFVNVVVDSMDGFQGAGFINLAKHTKGLQASGFINHAKSINGAQFTGFVNHSTTFVNGGQFSGFVNSADSVQGVQVTGFINHSRFIKGVQIAGFINHAKTMDGYQIGVINISDTCTGIPIGVFSYVKHGLHQLEVSADEVFYSNVSFRTGVQKFYNVFSAGASQSGKDLRWSFGYALGTSFKITKHLRSDLTLGTQHINTNSFTDGYSDLYKLYWGLEYKFTNKISIAAGPVFNLFLSDTLLPDYSSTGVAPYALFDNTYANGLNLKSWVGGKIAIRFF